MSSHDNASEWKIPLFLLIGVMFAVMIVSAITLFGMGIL
jgi:hypothetical protein